DLRAGLDAGRGDAALGALHEVQHREQARARLRVARRDLAELGQRLLRQRRGRLRGARGAVGGGTLVRGVGRGGHRSTPPMTGSMEAIATTTSATMPPSAIMLVACRLLKDGSRKCTR